MPEDNGVLQLRPNPASDQFTVIGFKDADVSVYDMSGRMVAGGVTGQPIDVSSLAIGVYVVRAEGQSEKLVVTR